MRPTSLKNTLYRLTALVAAVTASGAQAQLLPVEFVGQPPTPVAGQERVAIPLYDGAVAQGRLAVFSGVSRLPEGFLDPLGLSTQVFGGALEGTLNLGDYPVSGEIGYRFGRSLSGDEIFRRSHLITVSPSISLTPGTTTSLYYRHWHADSADVQAEPAYDADRFGAGLAQTWHFAGRKGRLRLEYGIETGRVDGEELRSEGRRFNISGVIPLRWGVYATVEAGYRRSSYPEYQGLSGLESSSTAFRAGVSGRFWDRLEADLNYSYADEEFEADLLPYRRRVWGLNLSYTY